MTQSPFHLCLNAGISPGQFLWVGICFALLGLLTLFTLRRLVLIFGAVFSAEMPDLPVPLHKPKMTVFVPAHNEAAVISDCIQALIDCDYPKDRLEVVVIDDDSTDDTARIVSENFGDYSFVRLMKRSGEEAACGKPAALNDALKEFTEQEICFFLDADSRVRRDALSRAATALHADAEAVSGRLEPINLHDGPAAYYTALECWTHQLGTLSPASRLGLNGAVLGSNWAIRREMLDQYGLGENELLEDTDISVAMNADGRRILFDEKMFAHYEVPATAGEYFRQHVGWGRGFSRIGRNRFAQILNGKIGPVRKLDLALYTLGYADRPLLVAYVLLIFFGAFSHEFHTPIWPFFIFAGVPILHMLVGFIRAGRPFSELKTAATAMHMIFVDIAAALTALVSDVFARPTRWYKTGRRGDAQKGSYMKGRGVEDE